ncbi:hypothetical protein Glove_67g158 [Diversispora epigaea]|uniref:F-box domain-containing protein n=1 Tax=Diversispora epigaea TaxID=1348612 RepID=A0A397JCL8_9GLOM|nr:hypothetical protein Glove_67g158 [Diversispora epigaea]
MILNNVNNVKSQDLYSTLLLVNRVWCKVTIPILWELPLGQECCTDDKNKLKKKSLCIRTYMSNGVKRRPVGWVGFSDGRKYQGQELIESGVSYCTYTLELPLGQECRTDNKNKLKKKALCIRTYISFMDIQARTYSKWI